MITTPVVLMILVCYHACGVDAPPWLPRLWRGCSSLVTTPVVWVFLVGYHACGVGIAH